jgi:ATP-binding cassette subfamily F protein 3
MIQLRNLRLQYGERFIFRDANASIGAKDRIGLIGSNGSGKTTMLKILAGQEEIDRGDVDKAKYVTIGYLPQDGIIVAGKTLYQEAESAFEDIISLNGKIEEASHQLQQLDTEAEAYTETLELIGTWERELENHDADKLPSRIEAVLHGLGFEQSDMDRQTSEFSGGWQMRIALAKLLLASPSLLLLDEPTNHLDIISQRWLENYLKRYEGAILMVSHDRAFLDELCTRSWELTQGSLHIYQGNYSIYEAQSSIRKEQLVRSFKNQQKEIERTEKFIDRFRSKASKATQVQSRIKALDKVERIEIETEEDAIDFSFPPAPRSGQVVIELENLSKSYGDLHVIRNASIRIERGDRIAVVGVNGAGKSTLAKVMAAVESFQDGERTLGHNTILSYFAQHQADELNPNDSVLETLENANTGQTTTQLRTALGAFLFHGDDVFKKTNVLSGGERNRLALSKILTQQANFLILDEPTNHLDMRSQDALQRALSEFEGAFIIVSHNRSFVDRIATKTLEVRKDGLSLFPGNVSDYLRHVEQLESGSSVKQSNAQETSPVRKAQSLSPKERRQLRASMVEILSPLKKRSKELEAKIAELETTQEEFEAKMANPDFFKAGDAAESMRHYDGNKKILEELYESWTQASDQLAAKEAELDQFAN